jgi:hypothetical protein
MSALKLPNANGPAMLLGHFILARKSLLHAMLRCAWA